MASPQQPNDKSPRYISHLDCHFKINKYLSALNPPSSLKNTVHEIFDQTCDSMIEFDFGTRALTAACLFTACHETRTHITLAKAVSGTGASMSHTLRALWEVESRLDDVSDLPDMEVTSTPSDGHYGISINGKPKKMYTLSWPRKQDMYLDPNWDSGYCTLWESYKRQPNKMVVMPVEFADPHSKDGTPAANPLTARHFIGDARAFSDAITARIPALSPENIQGTAKAWSWLKGSHQAHSNVTPSASAALATDSKGIEPAANTTPNGTQTAALHTDNGPIWTTPDGTPTSVVYLTGDRSRLTTPNASKSTTPNGTQTSALPLTDDGPRIVHHTASAKKLEPATNKVKAMKNVPEPTEKADENANEVAEQEDQVWENVDIADNDGDDKDWDLIDSKEIAAVENREKADAKVAAEKGSWTGAVRRGLFG